MRKGSELYYSIKTLRGVHCKAKRTWDQSQMWSILPSYYRNYFIFSWILQRKRFKLLYV